MTKKHPNNTVILKNKSTVQIRDIFLSNNQFFLKVANFRGKSSIYNSPVDSSILNTYEIEDKVIESTLRDVPVDNVLKKMIKMSFNFSPSDAKRTFVIPLLHD